MYSSFYGRNILFASSPDPTVTETVVKGKATVNTQEFILEEAEMISESFSFKEKGLEITLRDITSGISERRGESFVKITAEVKNNNSNPWEASLVSTYLELENGLKSDGAGFNKDADLKLISGEIEANSTSSGIIAWHFKDIESIEPGKAKVIKFAFTEVVPEEEKDGPFLNKAKFEDMYFEFR